MSYLCRRSLIHKSIYMKQYAVIHGTMGLQEGYSDTDCTFFLSPIEADKHIDQLLKDFRSDKTCIKIVQEDTYAEVYMYYEGDPADLTIEQTNDLDFLNQECHSEIIKRVEFDDPYPPHRRGTESCWLTWDQLDNCMAWDYQPLDMSLVARVASDVQEMNGNNSFCDRDHHMDQLNDFISSVYYRDHAFIDLDDYSMHAFRIPKPKASDSYDADKDDLKEWMDTNVNFIS